MYTFNPFLTKVMAVAITDETPTKIKYCTDIDCFMIFKSTKHRLKLYRQDYSSYNQALSKFHNMSFFQ